MYFAVLLFCCFTFLLCCRSSCLEQTLCKRNSLSTLETILADFGDNLSPKTATVAEFGDSRRIRTATTLGSFRARVKTELFSVVHRIQKFSFYRAMLAQSAVMRLLSSVRPSVCPSVTIRYRDDIGWKSWKLIARSIRPAPSLFVAQRPST